jgi:hypothetical protein
MIFVYLMGGMANQMFQIATGIALGLEYNDEVFFAMKTNLEIQATYRPDYKDTIFINLQRIDVPNFSKYKERKFTYKKIPYKKNMKLFGYFQSEQYFMKYKKEIIKFFKEFMKNLSVQRKLNNIMSEINHNNTISIHVRRQDYIHLQHVHVLQDNNYYKKAIDVITQKIDKDYKLVIFSDDITWCKNNNIFTNHNCYFVEGNDDYIDLYLMSMCTHHIIANSSFSWWGAYLNEMEKRLVVAPARWFGPNGPKKWDTIYCSDWLIV